MKTVLKYTLFAIFATMVNIGTQYLTLRICSIDYGLYIAMAMGTFTGLLVKYILDKKYIFYFEVTTFREDTSKFFLYSFMGVFTTIIFWGMELFFNAFFSGDAAKYIGAVVGLSIGYTTKYLLDRKFVFARRKFTSGFRL